MAGIGRAVGAALIAATLAAPAPAQDEAAVVRAATEPVMRQLEAFRQGDFDAAYTFASASVRELFDRAAFERMVRGGYPEIARSVSAVVAEARVLSDTTVYLRLRIGGANGQAVEAVYEMVREDRGWRINGVRTRPARDA
jgi:hypothetical protein